MSFQAKKLLDSLSVLESAVLRAKKAMYGNRSSAAGIANRLDCYLEVVQRQKGLAFSLQDALNEKDISRAEHYAELIRDSSHRIQRETEAFIREQNEIANG